MFKKKSMFTLRITQGTLLEEKHRVC